MNKVFAVALLSLLVAACGNEPLPEDIKSHLLGRWKMDAFVNSAGEEEPVTFKQLYHFMENDSVQTSSSTAESTHIETSAFTLEGTRLTVNELEGNIVEITAEEMTLDVELGESNNVRYIYRRPQ